MSSLSFGKCKGKWIFFKEIINFEKGYLCMFGEWKRVVGLVNLIPMVLLML